MEPLPQPRLLPDRPNWSLQLTSESVTSFAVCHEAAVDKEVDSCMLYSR
jgi:hypothetical protein